MATKHNEILVYVARHGTTDLNESNCFKGHLDPDLNGSGWRDAHALSFYFEPIELGSIFFSPKKRSRHTAMIINKAKVGLPYHGNGNLQDLDVGDLGGQKKTPENKQIVQCHAENPDDPFPGGESFNEFRGRVRPMLVDAVRWALRSGKPTLLVAHSSVIREAGDLFNKDKSSTKVLPGGVAAIYIEDGQLRAEPIFKPE
jgi:broad specificity phosphatase PhoE